MHADSVESLWDVLEGYGIIKPKTGTRPQPPPLPDPADLVEDDVYAEGYKAEDFHAPEHDEEEEEAPTNPFLDDLPEVEGLRTEPRADEPGILPVVPVSHGRLSRSLLSSFMKVRSASLFGRGR